MKKYKEFLLERNSFDDDDFKFKSKSMKNLKNKELKEYLQFFSKAFDSFIKNIKDYKKYSDLWTYLEYRVNGRLEALCDIGYYDESSEFCEGEHMWINYIYTDRKRQGIAGKLVDKLKESYPDYNFACMVRYSNYPSVNLFKKQGFKITGKYKSENDPEDFHVMTFIR